MGVLEANKYRFLQIISSWVLSHASYRSRVTTRVRNVVESVYGVRKVRYCLLSERIHLSLLPNLKSLLRILGAVDNAYHKPIRSESPWDESDLRMFRSRMSMTVNPVKSIVDSNPGLFTAKRGNVVDHINDFLRLVNDSPSDLSPVTLRQWSGGSYQGRLAKHYLNQSLASWTVRRVTHGQSVIHFITGFASRFKSNTTRRLFIQMAPLTSAIYAYCTCKAGARTIGSCCHCFAYLFYLCHKKHNTDWQSQTNHLTSGEKLGGLMNFAEWSKARRAEKKALAGDDEDSGDSDDFD